MVEPNVKKNQPNYEKEKVIVSKFTQPWACRFRIHKKNELKIWNSKRKIKNIWR